MFVNPPGLNGAVAAAAAALGAGLMLVLPTEASATAAEAAAAAATAGEGGLPPSLSREFIQKIASARALWLQTCASINSGNFFQPAEGCESD